VEDECREKEEAGKRGRGGGDKEARGYEARKKLI
jgi:hypothetical protein